MIVQSKTTVPPGRIQLGNISLSGFGVYKRLRLPPGYSMLDNPSQGRPAAAAEKFFHQELVTAFAAHYRLLILGPILAAMTAYFVVSLAPRGYTSWAYLKLDKPT